MKVKIMQILTGIVILCSLVIGFRIASDVQQQIIEDEAKAVYTHENATVQNKRYWWIITMWDDPSTKDHNAVVRYNCYSSFEILTDSGRKLNKSWYLTNQFYPQDPYFRYHNGDILKITYRNGIFWNYVKI